VQAPDASKVRLTMIFVARWVIPIHQIAFVVVVAFGAINAAAASAGINIPAAASGHRLPAIHAHHNKLSLFLYPPIYRLIGRGERNE
jgi:hypothetical protein